MCDQIIIMTLSIEEVTQKESTQDTVIADRHATFNWFIVTVGKVACIRRGTNKREEEGSK